MGPDMNLNMLKLTRNAIPVLFRLICARHSDIAQHSSRRTTLIAHDLVSQIQKPCRKVFMETLSSVLARFVLRVRATELAFVAETHAGANRRIQHVRPEM